GRDSLERVMAEVVGCLRCPRLVRYRQEIARSQRAAFRDWEYWGRPVPGFGDPKAKLLVVGLAPAAHGGNRTGRVFTGDRSGDWLYGALFRAGYANQATSQHVNDGLQLEDAYISAVIRRAPPGNKPTPEERDTCMPYLQRELRVLKNVKVIVCLGKFAYDGVAQATGLKKRQAFGHA